MTAPHQTPARLSSSRGERATGAGGSSSRRSPRTPTQRERITSLLDEWDRITRHDAYRADLARQFHQE